MEKMLINATQPEEIRVALVKENKLYDLDVGGAYDDKKKGNIYKAIIRQRVPSLDAVFVEFGAKRQGFLPLKEIAPEYLSRSVDETSSEKLPITALIREGQELLIQVDKEERGTKGAALTSFITLAGRYLVLMPNNPSSGGISRRIEGDDRDSLKSTLNALTIPDGMGVIIRTAGVGKSQEELQNDLDMLCNQWQAIQGAYKTQLAPCLIHQEGDVVIRSIRDNLRKSVNEIIIDDQIAYIKARQYIEQINPEFLPNVKLYNNAVPLFNLYQIESQIEKAYQREVLLPSGGALVIDRTEALVSIDINSAKSTSGADIETTALNTNLEAADEIARQLRLRDLGGLVVIDFIDMGSSKSQRDVENRLKEALKADRARIQVGRISRFGLLEMSRQRLRLSLGESTQDVCPRCDGRGTVRNVQSHSLSIIRLIEEEALKDKTAEVQVQLPAEMATYIFNEKRELILNIEKRHHVQITVISNPYLHSPQYQLSRVKEDHAPKTKKPSYEHIQQPEVGMIRSEAAAFHPDEPAVKALSHPARKTERAGFIKRLWSTLFSSAQGTAASHNKPKPEAKTSSSQRRPHPQRNSSHQGNRKKRPAGAAHPNRNAQSNQSGNAQQQQQQQQQQHPQHRRRSNNANPNRNRQASAKPKEANQETSQS